MRIIRTSLLSVIILFLLNCFLAAGAGSVDQDSLKEKKDKTSCTILFLLNSSKPLIPLIGNSDFCDLSLLSNFAGYDLLGQGMGQSGITETFFFETGVPSGWSGAWIADTDTSNCYSGNCLRSATIGSSSSTSISFTATTTSGSITFYRKVSSEAGFDYCKFTIDGSAPSSEGSGQSGSISWEQNTYSLSAGSHSFSWTYSKDRSGSSGSDACWIDSVSIPIATGTATGTGTGTSTIDTSTFPFETGVPTGWSGTWIADTNTSNCYNGSCLKSPTTGSSSSTSISFSATTSSGSISFYRKVSSESGFDYCKFTIDGSAPTIEGLGESGSVAWKQNTYSVSAGPHTFSWTYSKDSSGVSGSDACWIDSVTLPIFTSTSNASCSSGTALTYNTSKSGSVLSGAYTYYTFTASSAGTYSIKVTASSGDPDLYMNKNSASCPTSGSNTYSSAIGGSENYPMSLSSGDILNIGVYGYSSSSYTVLVQ